MKKTMILGGVLAGLLLMSCSGGKTVTVGAKNFTEQYIAAEMIALQLEDAGYKVDRRFGMSSFAMRQALLSGQVDICADYTGTGWSAYLKQEEAVRDPQVLYDRVKELDAENGVLWMDRMNFNNTYALAVTRKFAEENGLETLEDLAALEAERDFSYGLEFEFFERPDGFFAMTDHYGFSVDKGNTSTMDIGLTYEALDRGDVEISMVYSTDGNVIKHDLVVLEDTKNFFPIYNLCVVANKDFAEANPEALEAAVKMVDLIDQETITRLNYQVDAEAKESAFVAAEFLEAQGILK